MPQRFAQPHLGGCTGKPATLKLNRPEGGVGPGANCSCVLCCYPFFVGVGGSEHTWYRRTRSRHHHCWLCRWKTVARGMNWYRSLAAPRIVDASRNNHPGGDDENYEETRDELPAR
jgi:hypothetical protein